MKVHYGLGNIEIYHDTVVTTGTFDGVHLGHEKILNSLVSEAKKENLESVVLTFWPHPRNVIRPDKPLLLLSSVEEKVKHLERLGVDHLVVIEFTKEFSQMDSLDFLSEIIQEKLKTKVLIIGYDHRFGKNREGSFDYISDHQENFDFVIKEIERQDVESLTVSSTEIRKALLSGNLDKAKSLLGYSYSIQGTVIKGNQIGRQLNFPTANIEPEFDAKLIPQNGAYAVRVFFDKKMYFGMLNIGIRPTLSTSKKTIEVHIFDFNKEIYTETIEVEFLEKIRDEQKFNGLEELQNQLKKDKLSALKIIENEKIRD